MSSAPFEFSSGPQTSPIAFVGEAHGEQEALTGMPLMGASGQEFNRMIGEVGLRRQDVFCTNVFALRPPSNNIELLCISKGELDAQIKALPAGSPFASPTHPIKTPLKQGKYFPLDLWPEIERLYEELSIVGPNLVVAMGNTACWALLSATRIGALRGAVTLTRWGYKLLPIYHPAAVLRNWALRPVCIADLQKASREMLFPELRRPVREILVSPAIPEIVSWFQRPAEYYSVDTETKRKMIEMVSFARSPRDAIVIPFIDFGCPGWRFWPDFESELKVWRLVKHVLESSIPKVFQNGLYDLQYFARMEIFPRNCTRDTMLLHHAHFPELLKGLGFLGSIYTNEAAWKLMRVDESLKRDE